ncbi:MAG TPA: tetratricopeptide repeat protein [Pyrinomonadaceae bacterium]|nr:tetratricopeptide repeat protein [Pyrinomonadaceae bacterium]HMP66533.1 tetratricopeptide repeat protein [Pyrinomonadaceae bacterium]
MNLNDLGRAGRFAALVAMLALSAAVSYGQISDLSPSATDTGLGGINSIEGMVMGPGGEAIARARVMLVTMTRGNRIIQANDRGNFAFRGLVSGNYTIVVDKEEGFEAFSQNVDVIHFRGAPAVTVNVNVRLTRKASTEIRPAVLDASFAGVPKTALDHFTRGKELAEAGKAAEAVEEFKLAIEQHPEFTSAHIDIGVQYMRLNKLEEADAAFQAAIKLSPDSFLALLNRGMVNVGLERYGEAVPILRKALKINESSEVAHYFLGQALANLGLFDEAEKSLQIALRSGNENMKEAHRILAIIYSSKGDRGRAINHLETYLRLNPLSPDADKLRAALDKLKDQ